MTDEPFFHPNAIVESKKNIGPRTRVWAFAHILPGAVIGADCNICDHVFIENDVVVGDRVTIKSGVQLWDGIRLEDDVFVGPNATFTNDLFPRSKVYPEAFCETVVQKGASIGANATILPGVTIGSRAMVGAGAVVTHNVPAEAIVVGNPARVQGFVDSKGTPGLARVENGQPEFRIPGVRLIPLSAAEEVRGTLVAGEFSKHLPFSPKRFFAIFDVPANEIRGQHAHKVQHQFLISLRGSISIVLDNGSFKEEIVLDKPSVGLYIPPMIWAMQYKYSADAILLVLTSDVYDRGDYLSDYDEYVRLAAGRNL